MESQRNWMYRLSEWFTEDLPDKYGIFGLVPFIAFVFFLIVLFSIFIGSFGHHERSMTCSQGHYVSRFVYNASTKTSQERTVFVCDAE